MQNVTDPLNPWIFTCPMENKPVHHVFKKRPEKRAR
jgi:hypothetical protein